MIERVAIIDREGKPRSAVAPVIISASRATDIPRFFAGQFIDSLLPGQLGDRGYVRKRNPFNAAQVEYISFQKTRVLVFWSKDPLPLLPYLDRLDREGLHYYFHFTLNDYEAEGLEPGLPPVSNRLDTFAELSRRIGPERVIWRFDPLLLLEGLLSIPQLVERMLRLHDKLRIHTRKLIFSFADIGRYPAVQRKLKAAGFGKIREFQEGEAQQLAALLKERIASKAPQTPFELATCAEPFDLSAHGIAHSKCIDDGLMVRLWGDDSDLMAYLRPGTAGSRNTSSIRKDPGQRPLCGCIPSKDIGRYNTCAHGCVYCYAVRSQSNADVAFLEQE